MRRSRRRLTSNDERAIGQSQEQPPTELLAWGPVQVVGAAAGIAAVGFLSSWAIIYRVMATGSPMLDRFAIRGRLAFWTLVKFGPRAVVNPAIPRALMGIVHQESRGNPANYLGDQSISRCPSVGPMQVCRATAQQYGLVSKDESYDDYASRAVDEGAGIRWGVTVFKHKYDEHGGDVAAALVAYNGSGSGAYEYASQVQQYVSQTYA